MPAVPATVTAREAGQLERADTSGRTPVVFVHGLWMLPGSWDRWADLFGAAGYPTLTPGWPDDPATVAEARARPEVLAGKSAGQVADHLTEVIGGLTRRPVIIGHSLGGLLAQILAGRGLAAATVAVNPAPFRGVLPLSVLKATRAVYGNPRNRNRAAAHRRHGGSRRPSSPRSPAGGTRSSSTAAGVRSRRRRCLLCDGVFDPILHPLSLT